MQLAGIQHERDYIQWGRSVVVSDGAYHQWDVRDYLLDFFFLPHISAVRPTVKVMMIMRRGRFGK